MKTEVWDGCYDGGWNGLITPESFSHPAKMSYALLKRIITYGLEQKFWDKNSVLGDPFGGIGTTGLVAAYHGIKTISVELEPRFHALAEANFAMHRHKWERLGCPIPVCLLGDSREFARLVGTVGGIISSPPYAETFKSVDGPSGLKVGHIGVSCRSANATGYGTTPGQIGALREGTLDGVVSSPPFGDQNDHERPLDSTRNRNGRHSISLPYGTTDGQIGALPMGLDGLVTSPPWENQEPSHTQGNDNFKPTKQKERGFAETEYGSSEGQLGNTSGETYWTAMRSVYQQMHIAMKPGAVATIVVKDFVKNKKIVPLCDNTAALLELLGFTVFLRVKAMLVKEHTEADLFSVETTKITKKCSFFRRLAEKKGSPRIDWEEVIWCRKVTASPSSEHTSHQ